MLDVVAALDRFNAAHPWSHNDHYGPWVARQVRDVGAANVLDVGCGTGNLLALLRRSGIAECVGIDMDSQSAGIAAERFAADPAVLVRHQQFTGCPDRQFSAVVAVAVVHHLPLTWALRQLRSCLAPGGRLVVIGCYRDSSFADRATGCVAMLLNPILGLVKHPRRARSLPSHMCAPTAPAGETLGQIRAVADVELPGARVRRRLFWRYSLVYDEPR